MQPKTKQNKIVHFYFVIFVHLIIDIYKSVCFAVILPVMRHKVITNSTSKRVQEIELFFYSSYMQLRQSYLLCNNR